MRKKTKKSEGLLTDQMTRRSAFVTGRTRFYSLTCELLTGRKEKVIIIIIIIINQRGGNHRERRNNNNNKKKQQHRTGREELKK